MNTRWKNTKQPGEMIDAKKEGEGVMEGGEEERKE